MKNTAGIRKGARLFYV
ncbi:MAG TPA: hypothetical protein EYG79_06315 [Rhodobacteraceae bacterium]|nr:hypothetical protein [Paracoccaceae bacterium]